MIKKLYQAKIKGVNGSIVFCHFQNVSYLKHKLYVYHNQILCMTVKLTSKTFLRHLKQEVYHNGSLRTPALDLIFVDFGVLTKLDIFSGIARWAFDLLLTRLYIFP